MLNNQPDAAQADVAMPEDYAAFEAYRNTGKLPQADAETSGSPDAPAVDSEEETAADSEPADDTTEQDEEAEQSKDKPVKGKGGFQKKISKLTREVNQLREQLASRNDAANAQQPAKPAVAEGKPKLENFDSYEQYTDALTDFKLTEYKRDQEQASQRQQAEQSQRQLVETWTAKEEAQRAAHADYDDVLEAVSDVAIPAAMQQALLESEHGAGIAYELAKNPAELKRLVALSPLSASREIGKIEARFAAPAPQQKTTKAPPPVSSVRAGSSAATKNLLDDNISYADFERLRTAQLRRK